MDDNQYQSKLDLETRFLCKAYIVLIGSVLKEHLASTRTRKFTEEIQAYDQKAKLKLQSTDPKMQFTTSKLSKQEKPFGPANHKNTFGSRRNLRYLTSHSVRDLMEVRQTKSMTWLPTTDLKRNASSKKKFDNFGRDSAPQGLSEGGESLRIEKNGSSQREMEKQKVITKQRVERKKKALKTFRRKSCCCSECGGISKFEIKNEYITIPSKQLAEKLAVEIQKHESNKSCLSLVHHHSQGLSLFRQHRDYHNLSFAKASTPRLMNFSELTKQFSSEPKVLLSDKLLNMRQTKLSKRSWGGPSSGSNVLTLEELEKAGNQKYPETNDIRSSIQPESLKTFEDELIEKSLVFKTKKTKDRRQKSACFEPVSLFVEHLQERMKKLGLLGFGKYEKKKIIRKLVNPTKNQSNINKKISDIKEMSEGDDSIKISQEDYKDTDLLTGIFKPSVITGTQKPKDDNLERQDIKEGGNIESVKTRTSVYLSAPISPKNKIGRGKKAVPPLRINKPIREFKPLHLTNEGLVNRSIPYSPRSALRINNNNEKKKELNIKISSLTPYRAIVCLTDRNNQNIPKSYDLVKNCCLHTDNSTKGFSTQRSEKLTSFGFQETPRGVSDGKEGFDTTKLKIQIRNFNHRKGTNVTQQPKTNKPKDLTRVYTDY